VRYGIASTVGTERTKERRDGIRDIATKFGLGLFPFKPPVEKCTSLRGLWLVLGRDTVPQTAN